MGRTKITIEEQKMFTNRFRFGKIYKITSKQTDVIYIGSTVKSLSERMGSHKSNYTRYKQGLHNYVSSYQILEYDDAIIELIENYPCESKQELLAREGYYIKNNPKCINKHIACGLSKSDYDKRRWATNQSDVKNYKSIKHGCLICGGNYTNRGRADHIQSKKHLEAFHKNEFDREINKNMIVWTNQSIAREQAKKDNGITTLAERFTKTIECECGGSHINKLCHKTRHINSKKHQDWLKSQ